MIQTLMDNSLPLIFLVVLAVLAVFKIREVMKVTGLNFSGVRQVFWFKIKFVTKGLLSRLISAMIVSLIISMISYRTVWSNNVFHVVLLAMFIMPYIKRAVKAVLE